VSTIQGRSEEKLVRMLVFGFVSGPDFSRAAKDRKRIGLNRLRKNPAIF
jgi:hypothetical protein